MPSLGVSERPKTSSSNGRSKKGSSWNSLESSLSHKIRGDVVNLFKFFSVLLSLVALIGFQASLAQEVVPVPPQFTLDKKLPGEDPFSWTRPIFSPNGKYVAAFAHSNKTVTVWDVASGEVVAEVKDSVEGFDGVDGFDFNLDGTQLILLRRDLPLTFLDWSSGKVVRKIDTKADPKKILCHDFSDDQSLLVLGTDSNGIQVWDVKAGTKLKSFLPGQAISGVDYITYKTKEGKVLRQIGWGRALMPPNQKFENVAGIIDLDSGSNSPLLTDVPADKLPPEGAMTFLMVNWQWGGGHLLLSYYQIPPNIKAGLFVINATTKKYVSAFELGQKTINFSPKYLWKPHYGLSISSNDMSNPMQPVKSATQFIVQGTEGFRVLDTIDESVLPVQSISFNRDNTLAVVTQKKSMQDPATISIFKVSSKK